MLTKNKVIKAAASIITMLAIASASPIASAEKNYAEYGDGSIPMNSYGECWETSVGLSPTPECGGVKAPMMAMDSDNDGINDDDDKCPNTAPGVPVDATGCDLDSDGDGVADYKDNCPNSPAGTKVNSVGCADQVVIKGVNFDHDSAVLKSAATASLNHAASAIKGSGANAVNITGYTDSNGDATYNVGLSKRRANSVADYLANKGISRSMMSTHGMGEANPVGDNSTATGRAMNRRVEIDLVK